MMTHVNTTDSLTLCPFIFLLEGTQQAGASNCLSSLGSVVFPDLFIYLFFFKDILRPLVIAARISQGRVSGAAGCERGNHGGEVCSGRRAGAAGERGYRGRSSEAAAAGVEGTGDSTRSGYLLSLGSIASGSLAWGQGPFYLGGFGNIELSGGALPLPRAGCRG